MTFSSNFYHLSACHNLSIMTKRLRWLLLLLLSSMPSLTCCFSTLLPSSALTSCANRQSIMSPSVSILVLPLSLSPPNALPRRTTRTTTLCRMVHNPMALRKGITLPLLDIPDRIYYDNDNDKINDDAVVVLPLPSDHLPTALRDLNMYGMELRRPVHRILLEDAINRASTGVAAVMMGMDGTSKPLYGHLAWKPFNNTLVGAVGCVAEVLLQQADGDNGPAAKFFTGTGDVVATTTPMESSVPKSASLDSDNHLPKTVVVVCGAFRFVVREVVQTVPFPIAVVDELPDEPPGTTSSAAVVPIEYNDFGNTFDSVADEDEDINEDLYSRMSSKELLQDLFQTIRSYVDQKVEDAANQQVSPLEQSILQDTGLAAEINPVAVEQARAEQVAATWISFQTSLVDICPTQQDMHYAVAVLAAEVMDLENPVRRKLLTMLDGVERLRYVLGHVKRTADMARARRVAQQITDSNDESSKDLKVGTPGLPPWSRQITKGMKLSYYWNEEWEWCEAEVIEDPVLVVDELLVTVRFEDGEVHKLPFSPDEKARWRPAR